MYKTNITKTRTGHYTVSIFRDGMRGWPVMKKRGINSLEAARNVAETFIRQVTTGA